MVSARVKTPADPLVQLNAKSFEVVQAVDQVFTAPLAMLSDEIADEVKIDRTFISEVHRRPRSQGILRAIESLCGALGIDVVAEGVETQEELDHLRRHTTIGCAQGYWFARPLPLDVLLTGPEPVRLPPARGQS